MVRCDKAIPSIKSNPFVRYTFYDSSFLFSEPMVIALVMPPYMMQAEDPHFVVILRTPGGKLISFRLSHFYSPFVFF